MVLYGSNQPHQRNQEQEDAHSDDHADHPEAGNQPETNAPRRDSNEQQTDQLQRQPEGSGMGWRQGEEKDGRKTAISIIIQRTFFSVLQMTAHTQ